MSNILKRSDPRPFATAVVEIPEWGGAVNVRGVRAGTILNSKTSGNPARDAPVLSILESVFDADGLPFFKSREEVEDLDAGIFTRLEAAIGELFKPDADAIAKN